MLKLLNNTRASRLLSNTLPKELTKKLFFENQAPVEEKETSFAFWKNVINYFRFHLR